MHIKSVEAYFKTHGSLPLNVKFLIEGEEEIGEYKLVCISKKQCRAIKM